MRFRTKGATRASGKPLSPVVEGLAFIATVVFAVAVLAFEAIPPMVTARVMLALHRLEWRAVGIMAPLALGAVATLVCVIMAAWTAGRRPTPKAWVWLMTGAFAAPILALGGYRLAIVWIAVKPHG